MESAAVVALVSAGTSLLVVLLTQVLTYSLGRRRVAADRRDETNLRHLNPLRWHVAEAAFRIAEFGRRAEAAAERSASVPPELAPVRSAASVADQAPEWFVGIGCYVMSTAYLTACLFAELTRLREQYAYLRLRRDGQDTELAGLVLRVNRCFLRDHGVRYALQSSIGRDLILPDGRLRSYREFCELARDPMIGPWCGPVIDLYLSAGRGERTGQLRSAVTALEDLARALDRAVGGGTAIVERFRAERDDETAAPS